MRCIRTRSTLGRSSCSTTRPGCSMPASGPMRRSGPPGRKRTSTPRSASSRWSGIFCPGGPDDEHAGPQSAARSPSPGAVGAPAMRAAEPGPLRGVPAGCGRGRDGPGADAPDRRAVPGSSVPGLAPDGAELSREGAPVNRKRVQRLMRLMGIEALGPKPNTSQPAPGHKIYPYLLRGLTIERPNHVWAADITYIPIGQGFLYLVAIIDWASRAVLSWRLSNTMDTSFCLDALEDALARFGRLRRSRRPIAPAPWI